jgi:BASS family bile acid:Na+ symporter
MRASEIYPSDARFCIKGRHRMDPATLVKLILIAGIVLNVVAIGVRARPQDALGLLRQPPLAARAMLAMFLFVPLFVFIITIVFQTSRPVTAVLLALSVAPMPPLISSRELKAGAAPEYAIGLQFLATGFSLIAVPIMLALAGAVFGERLPFAPTALIIILALTVAVPLAIGMAIGHFQPGWREPVAVWASRIGWISLAIGSVALLAARGTDIIAQLGSGTLLITITVIAFALFIGHVLGGPDEGNRTALAITCAARHPGVAITLVSGLFPEDAAAVFGMTGLFWLTSFLMAIPYQRWRKSSLGL